MPNTDLDWLCEDASPEEVKRLMRLVHEWNQGDEQSFPVQLALLTRAQWRAVAKIPEAINKSRELTEIQLTEYRFETESLIRRLSFTADEKIKELSKTVTVKSEAMNQAVASVQAKLAQAESLAAQIGEALELGRDAWEKAKADYEAERKLLEQARLELDARTNRRDWLWVLLVLTSMVILGIAIGLRIAH
jgi:multidrug efflux pump subunit AcrA (membrane-fusion protein)